MIFGITASGGRRGQSRLDWRIKTIVFALASILSAAIVGALLGLLGGLVPTEARSAVGALAALSLAVIGIAYLTGRYRDMVQRNCETAQGWLDRGPLHWSIRNGAALGVGFMSRLGFVSWYVIPVACFLYGDPVLGAVLFGLYGGTRGFAPVVWLGAFGAGMDQDRFVVRLFDLNPTLQWASACLLTAVAWSATVAVGL